MTTIESMAAEGALKLFELPEWESRLPLWPLYIAPTFEDWAEKTAALVDPEMKIGRRFLGEHLVQCLSDFRCSRRPSAGDLRRMLPNKNGIWKMHPPGLRLYGWAPKPRTFVVVTGALEIDTKKDKRLNDRKRSEVLAFIKANTLKKWIVIGDINAVFPPEN
jgi:hypothetical protein